MADKNNIFSSELDVTLTHNADNAAVFSPAGSIDSSTADFFQRKIGDFLAVNNVNILLDMQEIKYISSLGLSALIALMKIAEGKKLIFSIYDTQLPVKRVLQIAHLDFLEVDPQKLQSSHPFFSYISSQEPQRLEIRKKREDHRSKIKQSRSQI